MVVEKLVIVNDDSHIAKHDTRRRAFYPMNTSVVPPIFGTIETLHDWRGFLHMGASLDIEHHMDNWGTFYTCASKLFGTLLDISPNIRNERGIDMIMPQHMCVYKNICVDLSNAHVRVYTTCVYEVSTHR